MQQMEPIAKSNLFPISTQLLFKLSFASSAPTKDFLAQLHIAAADQVQYATQSQLESERFNLKEILLWLKKKFSKISRKKSF